jgi:hypothetical protein
MLGDTFDGLDSQFFQAVILAWMPTQVLSALVQTKGRL